MRASVLAALSACLFLTCTGTADEKSTLQKRYAAFNSATEKNDATAMEKWLRAYCTKDFVYTSHDKNKYPLKTYLGGLKDQAKAVKKVLSSQFKIESVKAESAKITLTVSTSFEALVVFQGKDLKLTDKSKTMDVWVRAGSDWKLKSVTQTKADTQMFQKS